MRTLTFRLAIALLTYVVGVSAAVLGFAHLFPVVKESVAPALQITSEVKKAKACSVDGWYPIEGGGYLTFCLPNSMSLSSRIASTESLWGSTFSDDRIRVYAESSSWPSERVPEYLAKQPEYLKKLTEIDGRKAKVESWRSTDAPDGYGHVAEVRIYGGNGKMMARMSASCKSRRDVETAKQVFRTVEFP